MCPKASCCGAVIDDVVRLPALTTARTHFPPLARPSYHLKLTAFFLVANHSSDIVFVFVETKTTTYTHTQKGRHLLRSDQHPPRGHGQHRCPSLPPHHIRQLPYRRAHLEDDNRARVRRRWWWGRGWWRRWRRGRVRGEEGGGRGGGRGGPPCGRQ